MSEPREYWDFISYRHLDNQDAGREWATWIAREIETYEVPADLVGSQRSAARSRKVKRSSSFVSKEERHSHSPPLPYPPFRSRDKDPKSKIATKSRKSLSLP